MKLTKSSSMFWKSDFWVESREEDVPYLFSGMKKVTAVRPMCRNFELATQDQVDDIERAQKNLDTKLNLILEHLKLEYKPATEKKEPAKLVKRVSNLIYMGDYATGLTGGTWTPEDEKPKKKRGRPKKKK